jgi:tRNA-2-methylthio-N6-dimethylallyladenosine synthase
MQESRPSYHIWTIGCQMNTADARHVASQLEALGYQPAAVPEKADVLLLNTCVVRQQAEDKAYEQLRQLQRIKARHPDKTVAVIGCLVGHKGNPGLRERFPFVDVFAPPSDSTPLLDHLAQRRAFDRTFRDALVNGELVLPPSQDGAAVAVFVPVVLGCSHACAFCVIPYQRGAEASRPRKEILDEVRRLADHGVREVTLLGQIVDRYGLDLGDGSDLAGLLENVAGVDGIRRVRFLTSHPNWLTDRLLDVVAAGGKICPSIEVPAQAGNDAVLARMRRGYTADDYRRLVNRIRDRIPGAGIHTDLIVGFPGETEAQFMDTARLMKELDFDMARIAKYSERPQTLAARTLPDDVPEDEKERRRVMLEDLLAEGLERKHRGLVGRNVEVLVEERSRGSRWGGRTPQNKLVFFEDDRDLRGQLVQVALDWTGPFSLIGRAANRVAAGVQ